MKKMFFASFIIIASIQKIFAIDGIKFRIAKNPVGTYIKSPDDNERMIESNDSLNQSNYLFPVTLTFQENMMSSWSFRGAFFDYQPKETIKDLLPVPDEGNNLINYNKNVIRRQTNNVRDTLYNDFFNDSDKSFADGNPNWALSADITSTRYFLGYYWGILMPGKWYAKYLETITMIMTLGFYRPELDLINHRISKIGIGLGVFYSDLSYKLNLCSEYNIEKNSGECLGKSEIDSASAKGYGIASIASITLWEKYTNDSIWTILKAEQGQNITKTSDALKLNKHKKNLNLEISIGSFEILSYTKRF